MSIYRAQLQFDDYFLISFKPLIHNEYFSHFRDEKMWYRHHIGRKRAVANKLPPLAGF